MCEVDFVVSELCKLLEYFFGVADTRRDIEIIAEAVSRFISAQCPEPQLQVMHIEDMTMGRFVQKLRRDQERSEHHVSPTPEFLVLYISHVIPQERPYDGHQIHVHVVCPVLLLSNELGPVW
jgi:hypothetical protein